MSDPKEIKEEINKRKELVLSLEAQNAELNEVMNAEAIGDSIGTESIENLEEKISKYQQALKAATIGGEDYLRIQKKIADVQALMAKLQPETATTPLS